MSEIPAGLFAVFCTQSDGYTYSVDVIVGLYTTYDLAQNAIDEHLILAEKVQEKLKEIREERQKLWNEGRESLDKDFWKMQAELTKREYEASRLESGKRLSPTDASRNSYFIQQVAVNEPISSETTF